VTHREKIELLFAVTLCTTLLLGTCAVAYHGPKVAQSVTLALIAQWGVVAGMLWKSMEGRKS
jgi:hypothetical protein